MNGKLFVVLDAFSIVLECGRKGGGSTNQKAMHNICLPRAKLLPYASIIILSI